MRLHLGEQVCILPGLVVENTATRNAGDWSTALGRLRGWYDELLRRWRPTVSIESDPVAADDRNCRSLGLSRWRRWRCRLDTVVYTPATAFTVSECRF